MELSDDGGDILRELDSMLPGQSTSDAGRASADDAAVEDAEKSSEGAEAKPDATESPTAPTKPDAPDSTTSPTEDAPAVPAEIQEMLSSATPMAYTVDGQTRAFDGILEVKGQGGLIPADKLEQVRNTLAYADKAISDNRALYQESQQFRGLSYTSSSDQKEYKGLDAFRQLQADKAWVDAGSDNLVKHFADPNFIISLAYAYQNNDVAQAKEILASMAEKAAFQADKAQWSTLRTIERTTAEREQQGAEAGVVDRALDGAIQKMADWAREAGTPLSETDLKAARTHFGHFKTALYRDATPQERASGLPAKVVDIPLMHSWFLDRIERIKGDGERARQDEARRKAEAENARRTAIPAKPAPRAPSPKAPAAKAPKQKSDAEIAADISRAWKRGEHYTADVD